MEFLKKIIIGLMVMVLGGVNLSAMEQQPPHEQQQDQVVTHRALYRNRDGAENQQNLFVAHLIPVNRVQNQEQQVGPQVQPVQGQDDDCTILEDLCTLAPGNCRPFMLPDPDDLKGTGAEVFKLVCSGISKGREFVWALVPDTRPGLVKGLFEAGLTVLLPGALDQTLGFCRLVQSAHCPHQGIHWVILVGWSVAGLYSAAHLTKWSLS